MPQGGYPERRGRNDLSRNKAKHHAEPWSSQELEFLVTEWTGDDEDLLVIAEILGRTIEACRQRYYTRHLEPTVDVRIETEVRMPPPCPVCYLHHAGDCF